jgi:hypothetical protein
VESWYLSLGPLQSSGRFIRSHGNGSGVVSSRASRVDRPFLTVVRLQSGVTRLTKAWSRRLPASAALPLPGAPHAWRSTVGPRESAEFPTEVKEVLAMFAPLPSTLGMPWVEIVDPEPIW